ncbi:hypothetical protein PR048_013946 [Dryococelus australis]|uniref:Uncharacterized protein n=1 Tax=Dryococelus australis TaxID=614101 RepID=A0ABQ9HTL7_9NEOP|nr:hypothetical protein PR048_013946 [Dryococelus australis]
MGIGGWFGDIAITAWRPLLTIWRSPPAGARRGAGTWHQELGAKGLDHCQLQGNSAGSWVNNKDSHCVDQHDPQRPTADDNRFVVVNRAAQSPRQQVDRPFLEQWLAGNKSSWASVIM